MPVSAGSVVLAIVALGVLLAPRVILELVGRAGHGVARLFLPPEGMTGWPKGVQEDDRRWGWGSPPADPEPAAPATSQDGIEVIDL
jgi:hypothetical protein